MTAHGFRSMAFTLLNEMGWRSMLSNASSHTLIKTKSVPRIIGRNTSPSVGR